MKKNYGLVIDILTAVIIVFIPKLAFSSKNIPGPEVISVYISYNICKMIVYIIAILLLNITINKFIKENNYK